MDNILFDEQAVEAAIAYALDNPRRLAEKRAHPELFQVLRDLEVPLRLGGGTETARFAAIGNRHLLGMPHLCQVQCSRAFFEYRHDGQGRLLKDEPPLKATREFEEKREALFAAAEKGAVLVSPCISHGEKELARLAFQAGLRVIVLQNKGFSPLYKPGGRLFDRCAGGNLLMLAPVAWPYQPGEKPMTRQDACILNRLAQAISGPGAVEIRYRGSEPTRVEEAARAAVGLGTRAGETRA